MECRTFKLQRVFKSKDDSCIAHKELDRQRKANLDLSFSSFQFAQMDQKQKKIKKITLGLLIIICLNTLAFVVFPLKRFDSKFSSIQIQMTIASQRRK